MTAIRIVAMDEDFKCTCGNSSFGDGFYPCDEHGNEMQPLMSSTWAVHYLCNQCDQVYLDKMVQEDSGNNVLTKINPREHAFAFRLGMYDCFKVLTGKCSLEISEEEYNYYKPLTKSYGDGSVDYCIKFANHMAENELYTKDTGIVAHEYDCGHIAFSDGQHRTCIAKKKGFEMLPVTLKKNDGYICRVCHFKNKEKDASFLTRFIKKSKSNRKEELIHLEFIDDELKDYFWKNKR